MGPGSLEISVSLSPCFQQLGISLKIIQWLQHPFADRQRWLPTQRPDFTTIQKDERTVADPAPLTAAIPQVRRQAQMFSDPASGRCSFESRSLHHRRRSCPRQPASTRHESSPQKSTESHRNIVFCAILCFSVAQEEKKSRCSTRISHLNLASPAHGTRAYVIAGRTNDGCGRASVVWGRRDATACVSTLVVTVRSAV